MFEKNRGKGLVDPPRQSMSGWVIGSAALAIVAVVLAFMILIDYSSKHCLRIGYGYCVEPTAPTASPA